MSNWHQFESLEGSSGMVCTAMALRDGSGDQCGLPAGDVIHKHPSLVELEERIRESIEQGYQHGDVNHYIQPVIGIFRIRRHVGQPITEDDIDYAIEQMHKACNAENALLAYLHPEKYGL